MTRAKKTKRLDIRLTPAELAMIGVCCKASGMTRSKYLLRIAYLNYSELMQTWHDAGVPAEFDIKQESNL